MNLTHLEAHYLRALQICDPMEFITRQKQLLYAICDYLISKEKKTAAYKTRGSPKKLTDEDLLTLKDKLEYRTKQQLCKEFGIGRTTLYRYISEIKKNDQMD